MDPGAAVMDRADAEALLAEVLEDWLRERLSGPRRPDDLLVALFVDDSSRTGTLVRDLLRWMAHHRGAPVPDVPMQADPLAALRAAATALRGFLNGAACREAETVQIADELDALLHAAPGSGAPEAGRCCCTCCACPRRRAAPQARAAGAPTRRLTKWRAAAKASRSATTAERLNEEALACYAACKAAHEAAQSYAAGRVLHVLAAELAGRARPLRPRPSAAPR